MATYFHGNTEMQGNGDGLQTLILMNPAYVGYSDNHHHHHLPPPPPPQASNFIFLNSSSSATAVNHSNPPPSQIHHLAGIPLQAAAASSPQYQDVSELHGGSLPRFHYNLHNPLINNGAAREVTRAKQGLSLSLSPRQPTGPAPSQPPESAAPLPGAEEVRVPNNVLLSCKYLKVAQVLLDEVVNIGKEAKSGSQSAMEDNGQPKNTAELSAPAAGDGESGGGDGRAKRGAELTTAEKQEIQMKKAKLVNMLDEVEQRYKQYQHEMQMVISWFEEGAGVGSAKTYTALALQTISKQFRCLKDAILGQIRVASKKLGEEESFGGRFKYMDRQIRQQRGLQQLGMIQHNAWRPQRGLPERSVSVLRAWLFEHFLHPYPKDTDKIMLAKQTGLTRSQVSNWFINARVRLWKPMVEEMYAEEVKGHQGRIQGKTKHMKAKEADTEIQNNNSSNSTSQTPPAEATARSGVGFSLIGSAEMESRSPKKPRNADVSMSVQAEVENQHIAGYQRQSTNFFASYPIVGLEQFQPPYSGNAVSLTLGLQHCENLPLSPANQNFMANQSMHLGRGLETAQPNDFAPPAYTHAMGVYDSIDVHNSKRFAAQLLPDFVT